MYYITFDNIKFKINNISELHNITSPENVKKIYLSSNNLTNLDKNIFSKLKQLRSLDLYSSNNLTNLDKDIFRYNTQLQNLYLSSNNLTNLDKDIFRYNTQLQRLYLSCNKLTTLDKNIFTNLTELDALDLSNINLTKLDKDIFKYNTHLKELYLANNQLTTIPSSIINCTNLETFDYLNNEIDYIPPNIQRFLNNLTQKSNNLQIYNDRQNVHNHQIQECIKQSLENIINVPKTINKDTLINELIESNMNKKGKELLLEYCQDETIHSVLNITFEEALLHTLEIINLECNKHKQEIYSILDQEIQDSECKCFTGRISRLINCLNGFTPLVEIKIPDNMAISNIIVMIKQGFKGETEEELKEEVKKELIERGYDQEIIDEYVEYVEL